MAGILQRSQIPQANRASIPNSRKNSLISERPKNQPKDPAGRRPSTGSIPSRAGSRRGSMVAEGPFADWIYLGVNYDSRWDGWDGEQWLSGWNVRDDKNTQSFVKVEDLHSWIDPKTVMRGELLFRNRTDGKAYTEFAAFPNFRYKGRCSSQQDFGDYKELVLVSAYKRNPAAGKLGDPNFKLGKVRTGSPIEEIYRMSRSESHCAKGMRRVRDGSYTSMNVGADIWQDNTTEEFWVAPLPSMPSQAQPRSRSGSISLW